METAVLVAADDVEGERRAVPGRVFVRHDELEDAAADRLALLQETRLINSPFSFNHSCYFMSSLMQQPLNKSYICEIKVLSFGFNGFLEMLIEPYGHFGAFSLCCC